MSTFLGELLSKTLPHFVIEKDRTELFFHLVERCEKGMENVSFVLELSELG
jgi:hypothetical protein